tara:strand:+ start:1712 stop:2008 length:297 start_codon:yes stop_codon:yes gene_type:complete
MANQGQKSVGQLRFTGDEDRALTEIMEEMKPLRWEKVAKQLHERGFAQRTGKSIRNHHLRRQKADRSLTDCKNRCRRCGMWRKGHTCAVTSESSPPET